MRILVSGGSGYIGGMLARRLLVRGHEVHLLLRKLSRQKDEHGLAGAIRHPSADTREGVRAAIADSRPEIVVHLAAFVTSREDPESVDASIDANIRFGTWLIGEMVEYGCDKIINTGTFWQHYGGSKGKVSANFYAATKEAFECILDYYCASRNLKAMTLLLPDTYGPLDTRNKLIPSAFDSAIAHTPFQTTTGDQECDMLYIEDVLDGYERAIELMFETKEAAHRRFGLSSTNVLKVHEIVALIEGICAGSFTPILGALPYRSRESMVVWRPRSLLPGWAPKTDLSDGLKAVWLSMSQGTAGEDR